MQAIQVGPKPDDERGTYAVDVNRLADHVGIEVTSRNMREQCRVLVNASVALNLASDLIAAVRFERARGWQNAGETFAAGREDGPWLVTVGAARSVTVRVRHIQDDANWFAKRTADDAAEVEMSVSDAAAMACALIDGSKALVMAMALPVDVA